LVNAGISELKNYQFSYNSYEEVLNDLSTEILLNEAESSINNYERIIASRLLFERKEGLINLLRKKYPAAAKFINETNHIENDYVFQLDPCKFFDIPSRYLDEIVAFLIEKKSQLLEVC